MVCLLLPGDEFMTMVGRGTIEGILGEKSEVKHPYLITPEKQIMFRGRRPTRGRRKVAVGRTTLQSLLDREILG